MGPIDSLHSEAHHVRKLLPQCISLWANQLPIRLLLSKMLDTRMRQFLQSPPLVAGGATIVSSAAVAAIASVTTENKTEVGSPSPVSKKSKRASIYHRLPSSSSLGNVSSILARKTTTNPGYTLIILFFATYHFSSILIFLLPTFTIP